MLPTAEILEKLAFLYQRTPDKAVSGSKRTARDWYALNPVIPEDAVQVFEAELGLRLPEDFRAFVTTVGNGSAGLFRSLGDHCFAWGIEYRKLETPFDWDDFIRVKKYTEAQFKQQKKGEMERILRFYKRYIPVERPNRYQKEVKALYNIDLEEDEYIEYAPCRDACRSFNTGAVWFI